MKIYAVYKGDEFLCEGTSKECAKQLGVKQTTVLYWNTKTYRRRIQGLTKLGQKRNRKIAIVIEERKK